MTQRNSRADTLPINAVASWSRGLAASLGAESAEESAAQLAEGLSALAPDTRIYVGLYRRKAPPVIVDVDGHDEWNHGYSDGKYLLDPTYDRFLAGRESVCLSPREIFPPDFRKSDYYLSYYRPYGMVDEICYLLHVEEDMAVYVSLMRLGPALSFTAVEYRRLNAVLAAVESAAFHIRSLMRNERQNDDSSFRLHQILSAAYERFGGDSLSEREKEVTNLLLKGLPPKAVGRLLGIAPGTVRNHIKRIYVKLDVRSQAELLALFFETLDDAAADAA
ncbi:MAG: LuxR C-terminal-related transcriptional regulator [Parvibaculum sp.]